jgi:hypothetical protein
LDALFQGGENSLVAIALGRVEGTRLPDGQKTFAYYGKTNPRTQEWGIGTFSLTGDFDSPEAADQQYLVQLRQYATKLQEQAANSSLAWNREIQLNAIDMAHQQADSALAQDGFVERLQQAHAMGLEESEAVTWARTRSMLASDPADWNQANTNQSVQSVTEEQARRQAAIAQFLEQRQGQQPSNELKPDQIEETLTADQPLIDQGLEAQNLEEAWVTEVLALDLQSI